jgi:hypothetical protein
VTLKKALRSEAHKKPSATGVRKSVGNAQVVCLRTRKTYSATSGTYVFIRLAFHLGAAGGLPAGALPMSPVSPSVALVKDDEWHPDRRPIGATRRRPG